MMLGDKMNTKKKRTYNTQTKQKYLKKRFLVEYRQATFNTNVLKVYINFQRNKINKRRYKLSTQKKPQKRPGNIL